MTLPLNSYISNVWGIVGIVLISLFSWQVQTRWWLTLTFTIDWKVVRQNTIEVSLWPYLKILVPDRVGLARRICIRRGPTRRWLPVPSICLCEGHQQWPACGILSASNTRARGGASCLALWPHRSSATVWPSRPGQSIDPSKLRCFFRKLRRTPKTAWSTTARADPHSKSMIANPVVNGPSHFLLAHILISADMVTPYSIVHISYHIFQNAQVTRNKMVHKKRYRFLGQFSIPFHMVWSVFFANVSSKNHPLGGWNSLPANQKLLFNGFWS